MIHVIATIELSGDHRAAFLTEFHQLAKIVRTEDGCLEYGPAIDLTNDNADFAPPRSSVVTVIEKWDSLPALRAHLKAPHMAAYRSKVGHLIAGVTIQVLEPA